METSSAQHAHASHPPKRRRCSIQGRFGIKRRSKTMARRIAGGAMEPGSMAAGGAHA